jgi:S1-C subfamily serine protease
MPGQHHIHFPKLPDWAVYAAIVLAFFVGARSRNERADAPSAPPPPAAEETGALGGSPFGAAQPIKPPADPTPETLGTAFSVADTGVWLSARHVFEGCSRAALIVGPGRGVSAEVELDPESDVAILRTLGGAPALPLALDRPLQPGQRAFHPGYPRGRPGEAATLLLGRQTLEVRGRGERGSRPEPVLAWAESGRTDKLRGDLAGLSGAPALDGSGRVVGLTIAEAPRRGRIYTVAPETLRAALERAGVAPSPAQPGDPVTVENYGRAADTLRRELRVAEVMCLKG